jgi:hypothetical protein
VVWLGKLARRTDRSWLMAAAADELVGLSSPEATGELVTALAEHPRAPALIWAAVRAGAGGAAAHLIATLTDAGAGPHRPVAALALGALPWPAAAPALRAALTEPDPALAHAAAWALGQLQDAAAGPLLANRLDADRTGVVAWALARTGHRAAAGALIQRLGTDREATASGVARRTLVALAAARLADDAQAALLIDVARQQDAPIADALRRALAERVTPPRHAVDVFPFVPFVRVPLPIHAGDVVELAGQGMWAQPGAAQLASATVEQRLDEHRRFGLTYWLGSGRGRVTNASIAQPVERESALVLGPVTSGHDTELTAPLAGAHGHARVTIAY